MQIHADEILETYGGENGTQSGLAYMLIYRRIDPALNSLPLTLDELPQDIVVRHRYEVQSIAIALLPLN